MELVKIRKYQDEDFEMLTTWWKMYSEWEQGVPKDILPQDGWIVNYDNSPVCAAFMYITANSNCAWLEWIIADPHKDAGVRSECLDKLISVACEYATEKGCNFQFICVKHPKLMKRLEDHGFIKGDKDMQMMIRRSK